MKKNRSLGVFEEIKRISVSFVILAFIGMMALLFTMDAGCNYTNIQDYGHMDFYTDYFTINGFDTGSIIISASGIDEEKTSIAEEDIILQGFTAETSITYLSKEEGNVFCVIRLSNMESASDLDEKTISLKEGVISVEDKASPSVTLRGLGNKFVSMREYTVYCILFFSLYNILFLFNASILDGGGIASSVLLWIESLAYEGPIVLWLVKIVRLNLAHKYILFSLFLLIVEFCFFICVSKNLLTTKGYCLFIIFLSTTALAQFSQIFTIYYIHIRAAFELPAMGVSTVADEIYEISGDSLLVDTLTLQLNYIKFSFRYFFTFPPDEYYGWISILQFALGRIYEVVVFGSVGAFVLEQIRHRDKQRQGERDCNNGKNSRYFKTEKSKGNEFRDNVK